MCIFFGCTKSSEKITETEVPSHWVGDIHFDSKKDKPDFSLCDSTNIIHRRNGLNYPGGKEAIKKECLNKFQFQTEFKSFSGYIMVRFLMNCKNKTGRYRAAALDFNFSEKNCPPKLKEHLVSIVKELTEWKPSSEKNGNSDFSKYLNFKIKNGQIENILH